jgi:hypothetical protein
MGVGTPNGTQFNYENVIEGFTDLREEAKSF